MNLLALRELLELLILLFGAWFLITILMSLIYLELVDPEEYSYRKKPNQFDIYLEGALAVSTVVVIVAGVTSILVTNLFLLP